MGSQELEAKREFCKDADDIYYMLRKWDFPPEVLSKIEGLLHENAPAWAVEFSDSFMKKQNKRSK